jgi:competence protein ComGC
MAQMDSMLVSLEEYTINANQVKDLVLERLKKDGLITEKQGNIYSENWQVIIIKSNWFEIWSKKFGIKVDGYKFKFVNFE